MVDTYSSSHVFVGILCSNAIKSSKFSFFSCFENFKNIATNMYWINLKKFPYETYKDI